MAVLHILHSFPHLSALRCAVFTYRQCCMYLNVTYLLYVCTCLAMHFLSVIYCIYVFLCGSLSVQNKVILNRTNGEDKVVQHTAITLLYFHQVRFADGHLKFVFVKMQPALPLSRFVRRHGGKRWMFSPVNNMIHLECFKYPHIWFLHTSKPSLFCASGIRLIEVQ